MTRFGKIALPVDDAPFQATWTYWKSSQAFRKGLLDAVQMPAARDLVYVEDIAEEALPATTSLTHGSSSNCPAEKACQLGLDAHRGILRGFLQGLNTRSYEQPHLVVDLFGHVGEMAKACLHEKFNATLSGPVYYLGFHADQVEASFLDR